MLILSEERARQALDEVGDLQRQIEAETIDFEFAGLEIVERLDAVVFLYDDEPALYGSLIEPMINWAMFKLGPHFVRHPESDEGRRYRALYDRIDDFYTRNKHRNPETTT